MPQPQQLAQPSGMGLGPQDSAGALESMASALAPQLLQLQPAEQQPGKQLQVEEVQPALQGSDSFGLLPIASTAAAPIRLTPNTPMIAREAELAAITERCVELVQRKQGGVVLVEGEAGMGKSRLVEELQQSELGGVYDSCNLFLGLGRRERKSQALYPWRRVLREMFHHDHQLGQVYCLKDTEPVVVVTELSLQLQEGVSDFAQWRHLLADALELPLSEFPAVPEEHRRLPLEQRHRESPLKGAPDHQDLSSAEAARQLAETVATGLNTVAHSSGLREEEEAFLSAAGRARSFASRVKRSASLTMDMLGQWHHGLGGGEVQGSVRSKSPTMSERDRVRATATPSPRKMERIRKQHEATVLQQAEQAAALEEAARGRSSDDSDGEQYSSSDTGSYSSSPVSSFTAGSVHSLPGSSTGHAGGGGTRRGDGAFRNRGNRGSASILGKVQQWPMQHAATSRAAGALALKSIMPTREISTHLRAKKVQELVVEIIRQFTAAYGPLILVLEDLHHFDTASWRLLTGAISNEELRQSVLFILSYRPYFGALSPALRQSPGGRELRYQRVQAAYHALLSQPNVLHLVLHPFDVDQSSQFVSAALGGAQVPPEVAVLLWERSSGLPSFLEQLVVFLQLFVQTQLQTAAAGHDGILRPGRRSTVEEVQAVAQAGLDFIRNNVSINSIITDRVDRLRPEEQLTLKVASVLGLTIYRQLLQATHPQHPPPAAVEASLCALEAVSFLRQDSLDASTWRFCQVLARDVVYEMVPKELRRDWHAAAAAAMETYSSGQFHLPPSTIAWHWSQSCRDEEVPQWQRSFRAVEWWERAAAAALDNGGYAEALPLLQKAQDVAAALESYFAGHSRSFFLMRHQSLLASLGSKPDTVLPGAGTLSDLYDSMLLVGMSTWLTANTAASTRGSASQPLLSDVPQRSSGAAGMLPLVPRLRRAHWERCMAAMCMAVELTAESLHEAKAHCLLALHLLGVPLPSSEEFLGWRVSQQHWWTGGWLGGGMPSCACISRSAEDPLQQRAAHLESGAYAWMTRPDLGMVGGGGGTSSGGSLTKKTRRAMAGHTPPLASTAAEVTASSQTSGGGGRQQWQQLSVPSDSHANASDTASNNGAGGPGKFASIGISTGFRSVAAWPTAAAEHGSTVSTDSWMAHSSISLSPPLHLQPPQPPQQRPCMEAVQVGGRAAGSLTLFPSPFAAMTAAGGPAAVPAVVPVGGRGLAAAGPEASSTLRPCGSHMAVSSGTAAVDSRMSAGNTIDSAARGSSFSSLVVPPGSSSQHMKPPRVPKAPSSQLATAGTAGGQQRRQSEGYRQRQAVGLDAAQAESQQLRQRGSQYRTGASPGDSDSLSVVPAFSGQADLQHHEQQEQQLQQGQEEVQKQVDAFGLAGGDERFSARAKAEAGVVLDLLCSLLLAQPQLDVEGLQYLRWACRHLQGGRVKESSSYRHIYADAGLALRLSKHRQAGPRSSLARGQQQRHGGGVAASLSRTSLLSLSSMARAVAAMLATLGSRTAATNRSAASN